MQTTQDLNKQLENSFSSNNQGAGTESSNNQSAGTESSNNQGAGTESNNKQGAETESKQNAEFEKFKRGVLTGTIYENRDGNHVEDKEYFVPPAINAFPLFLQEHFTDALILLAERDIHRDFHRLIKHFIRKFNVSTLIKLLGSQNEAFMQKCGPCLLFSAIKESEFELLKFLINEKNISVNCKLHQSQPLAFVIYNFETGNQEGMKLKEEVVELLLSKKANVNFRSQGFNALYGAVNGVGFRSASFNMVEKILMHGASPFCYYDELSFDKTRETNIKDNPLTEATRVAPSLISILCEYGAGFIVKEARFSHELPKPLDVKKEFHESVMPTDVGVRKIHFYKYAKKLQDTLEIDYDAHQFIDNFFNAEIVFRFIENNKPRWIFTLKELSELLSSNRELDETLGQKINLICASVLQAPDDIIAPNVRETFEKYRAERRARSTLIVFELERALPSVLSRLIMGYENTEGEIAEMPLKFDVS